MTMSKPSREEAKLAIRTLLSFIGDDPDREGLIATPDRMIDSYHEMFCGYNQDVRDILDTKFYDTYNFKDLILLRSIRFTSFCEHHLLPISGYVDIAYIPNDCVVGISKLARLVDVFAKRLQIQEKMTAQIAESLQSYINPLGVAVKISASHGCMTIRGVLQESSVMDTMHYTGIFTEQVHRQDFINLVTRRA